MLEGRTQSAFQCSCSTVWLDLQCQVFNKFAKSALSENMSLEPRLACTQDGKRFNVRAFNFDLTFHGNLKSSCWCNVQYRALRCDIQRWNQSLGSRLHEDEVEGNPVSLTAGTSSTSNSTCDTHMASSVSVLFKKKLCVTGYQCRETTYLGEPDSGEKSSNYQFCKGYMYQTDDEPHLYKPIFGAWIHMKWYSCGDR